MPRKYLSTEERDALLFRADDEAKSAKVFRGIGWALHVTPLAFLAPVFSWGANGVKQSAEDWKRAAEQGYYDYEDR